MVLVYLSSMSVGKPEETLGIFNLRVWVYSVPICARAAHGLSIAPFYNHTKAHNKALEMVGECPRCRRIGSEYSKTRAKRRAPFFMRFNDEIGKSLILAQRS